LRTFRDPTERTKRAVAVENDYFDDVSG